MVPIFDCAQVTGLAFARVERNGMMNKDGCFDCNYSLGLYGSIGSKLVAADGVLVFDDNKISDSYAGEAAANRKPDSRGLWLRGTR